MLSLYHLVLYLARLCTQQTSLRGIEQRRKMSESVDITCFYGHQKSSCQQARARCDETVRDVVLEKGAGAQRNFQDIACCQFESGLWIRDANLQILSRLFPDTKTAMAAATAASALLRLRRFSQIANDNRMGEELNGHGEILLGQL